MDAIVHAPLGSWRCLILCSRISRVCHNRPGIVSAVNLFRDQVGQNEGASIGRQEITRSSRHTHRINTSFLYAWYSIVVLRLLP